MISGELMYGDEVTGTGRSESEMERLVPRMHTVPMNYNTE